MSRSDARRRPVFPVFIRSAGLAVLLACSSTCGGKSSPAAPDPAPAVHANITVQSLTVVGESRSGGYAYRVTAHLRETAGVAATISSVDLAFVRATTVLASSHHEQPLADASGVCAANGAIDTRELITLDDDPSHPFAATVQATVRYSDSTSFAATVTTTAEVPPVPVPPPAALTLTGTVADLSTKVRIEGAHLEVVNGTNLGRTTTTDPTGTYQLRDLSAGSFRLRASAAGHIAIERDVAVPSTAGADFELQHACAYTLSPASITVPATVASAQFKVTATGAGNCAWTASTFDPWLSVDSVGDVVSVFARGAESAQPRTGTISVHSPGGNANFTVTQEGAVCGPSRTVAVPADLGSTLIFIGAGCVTATQFSSDVPWLFYASTHAGHVIIAHTANPGPERTGTVTFSGVGLSVRLTFVQAAR